MEEIRNFAGGLNKDLDKLLLTKSQYVDAQNFRLFTTTGGTQLALNNVKGNGGSRVEGEDITYPSITFPGIQKVYTLKPILALPGLTSTITIQGITTSDTFTGTTIKELYNYIVNHTDFAATINKTFFVSYNEDTDVGVVIYTTSTYTEKDPITSNLTITTTPDLVDPLYEPIGPWIAEADKNIGVIITETIILEGDLKVIGWCTVRDDIIIFTTNDTGIGQLWRLRYDDTVTPPCPDLKLLYSNQLNFSTDHPIQAVGRYETDSIQRVYWTDGFNKIRSLNIAGDKTFATSPNDIFIASNVILDLPRLWELNRGGKLLTGVYNICYRLISASGIPSAYSPLSTNINIITGNEENNDISLYFPADNSGTNSGKSITIVIDFLDNNFSNIELVYAYRTEIGQVPVFKQFLNAVISSSTSVKYTLTGNEEMLDVDLGDIIEVGDIPSVCKTMTSKDNALIIGNVKSEPLLLEGYDTRAYRWPATNFWGTLNGLFPGTASTDRTQVIDILGNFETVDAELPSTGDSAWGVPSTHDAINPRQAPGDISTGTTTRTTVNYKFQKDGLTIGGSGPNISYKIVTTSNTKPTYNADSFTTELVGDTAGNNNTAPRYGKKRRNIGMSTPNTSEFNLNGRTYNDGGFSRNFMSPYFSELLRGYQREETYRFGIQFYDKLGRPYFVKWIADILMPSISEIDGNNSPTELRETFKHTSNTNNIKEFPDPVPDKLVSSKQVIHSMGVRFTLNNLNTISDKISGYSIVRVKREQNDKTILGAGLGFNSYKFDRTLPDTGRDEYYINHNNDLLRAGGTPAAPGGLVIDNTLITLISPEFLFGGLSEWRTGDKLIFVNQLQVSLYGEEHEHESGPPVRRFYQQKAYTSVYEQDRTVIDIDGSITLGLDSEATDALFPNSFIYNRTVGDDEFSQTEQSKSKGARAPFFKMHIAAPGLTSTNRHYIYYYRPNAAQYGGNTYIARANNIYQMCGHFQRIPFENNNTIASDVFGGDTYIPIFEHQKLLARYPDGNEDYVESSTYWFPVESTINTELRREKDYETVNRYGIEDADVTLFNTGEGYGLFSNYFNENDTKEGVIIPTNFIENTSFDNRIYSSGIKFNGEPSDSWTIFKTNDYLDLESEYGAITNLMTLNDKVVAFQDKAVALISINPKVLINTEGGADSQVQLGSGLFLDDFRYISTESGTKHQWSITKSSNAIYYFDTYKKKIMKVSFDKGMGSLSDTKGLRAHLHNHIVGEVLISDIPNAFLGISSTFDYKYSEMRMSFILESPYYASLEDESTGTLSRGKTITIVFNEDTDSFTSFYSHASGIYMNPNNKLITIDSLTPSSLYLEDEGEYGKFYQELYPSTLKLVSNENKDLTKAFNKLSWITNSSTYDPAIDQLININNKDTFGHIRLYNDYQNTDFQSISALGLNSNITFKERIWRMAVPRNRVNNPLEPNTTIFDAINLGRKPFADKLRDTHLYIDFEYDNTNNYTFSVHDIRINYNTSNP